MLVATDLDGTLVPNDCTSLTSYTARILASVDAAGIPVVFITARPLRWMEPFWPQVGKHGRAIVSNGAITYDVRTREVLAITGIEPVAGLEIAAAITSVLPDATFAIECADGIRQDQNFVEPYPVPPGSPRGLLHEIWDVPAVKLLVRHASLGHEQSRDHVVAAVGDAATATWSAQGLIEVSAIGVTKASALARLCVELGVAREDVIAFGDMPNDIPMLAWAGTSYAVANAHESVHAVADHVAPRCDEDGVARVLDALVTRLGAPTQLTYRGAGGAASPDR